MNGRLLGLIVFPIRLHRSELQAGVSVASSGVMPARIFSSLYVATCDSTSFP